MAYKEIMSVAFFTLFILVLFVFLKEQVLFSPDVSYLLHATQQILQGGHYGRDIFETNPPMILYLYSPVIILAKMMSIDVYMATRIYMFFMMSISAVTCVALLLKIIDHKKDYYVSLFFGGILFVYVIFSIAMFAQREHILLVFILPYLLCAVLKLDDKSVNPWLAVLIGLFAGFGFAIKPYFLVTLCLVESLFVFEKRKLFAWVRIESVIIASILIGYLASIFIFQSDYITIILPLLSKYYFPMIKQSWVQILTLSHVSFILMVTMMYPIFRKYDRYPRLGIVIYVALLGMIMAFMIPKSAWYYHVYPAFSLALLLMLHGFAQQLQLFMSDPLKKSYIVAIMLMLLYIPLYAEWKFFHMFADFKKYVSTRGLSSLFNNLSGDHSINCFTATGTASCFPGVHGIKEAHFQGSFPFYWWYEGLVLLEKNAKNNAELNIAKMDKKMLFDAIAEDLNHYKTRWVIVDTKSFERFGDKGFDVIASFLTNDSFRAVWANYALYTKLPEYDIYIRKNQEKL